MKRMMRPWTGPRRLLRRRAIRFPRSIRPSVEWMSLIARSSGRSRRPPRCLRFRLPRVWAGPVVKEAEAGDQRSAKDYWRGYFKTVEQKRLERLLEQDEEDLLLM